MHVYVLAVWYSSCVLGSGPEVPKFKPNFGQFFHLIFHVPPTAPPVHPAVIGDPAFAGVQIQGFFSCNSNGPGGILGVHTTSCEERYVLLRVPSSAPGALLAWLTVPA